MGMWDEYCMVCGGPPCALFDNMEDAEDCQPLPSPPPNPADYTWLESFIGISNKEELIPLTSYDNCGNFDIQLQPDDITPVSDYTYFVLGCRKDEDYIDEKAARGYACHVACYKLLQQELNYSLKYADVQPLLVDNEYDFNKFSWSDYGGLAEHQEQFFDDVQLVKDGKLWMVEDPSRDEQNKERILRLWRPLVESGFKRPDEARVRDDGGSAQELVVVNGDEARA